METPIQHARQSCTIANLVSSILAVFSSTLLYQGFQIEGNRLVSLQRPVIMTYRPAKIVSMSVFPAMSLGWIALAIYFAQPQLKGFQGRAIDHATFSVVQRQCGIIVHRVNIARMLCSVFSVLFLWRLSIFFHELGKSSIAADGSQEEVEKWFTYTKLMTGMGLSAALLNTYLYHRLVLSHRRLKQALRLRFRRSM